LKPLSEKFYLILIDVIGVATSGRPSDYLSQEFTAEQSVQYFIDYFEKWRVEMGNLHDFYLVGHSFGGYMMGNYAN
jgi:pimeloyl-ACP methyl ester carboxylesterase